MALSPDDIYTHFNTMKPFNWRIKLGECVYLYRIEDGLQHGQDVTEEEVPRVGQGVQQLLTCETIS